MSTVALAQTYAAMGKRSEAEQQITILREMSKTRYIRHYYFVWVYAALGDKDKAFEELEHCYAERDAFIVRMKSDPFMDPIRGDPRFDEMVKRLNLLQ
jgi:hypothetical protein